MKVHQLVRRQHLNTTSEEAWRFFCDARNLNELTPPGLHFRIVPENLAPLHDGQIIWYEIRLFPGWWQTWITEICHVVPGSCFVDNQVSGPYTLWHHRHAFEPHPEGGVVMTDTVHYALPFGPLGDLAHAIWVGRQVRDIFDYRARAIARRFGEGANLKT